MENNSIFVIFLFDEKVLSEEAKEGEEKQRSKLTINEVNYM